MTELQPVGLSPFWRIRITASFKSSCDGDSVRSHLRLFLYHSIVAGVTFARYCRSRMNCSKRASIFFSPQVLSLGENRVNTGLFANWIGELVRDQGVGGSNPLAPTIFAAVAQIVGQ